MSTYRGKKNHSQLIRIEDDCWNGYGIFIKQGVNIGRGAIIGAYSIVIKDVFPCTVQVGSPAKELKKRIYFDPPAIISGLNYDDLPCF